MQEQIYVQIPAYRDRELAATLHDLFRNAAAPARLRVAVAWQYGESEEHLEPQLRRAGPVELLKIPAAESQGCNWARQQIQQNWNGEKYTLFLDSHHRFAPGWDAEVIRIHEACRDAGAAKPIITSYLPPYDPGNDPAGRANSILQICVAEKRNGMPFRLHGHAIPRAEQLRAAAPAHFVSLHFLFADGAFNEEVPFDPQIYFFADEIAIALRAFTRGYELFHPHRVLGWHLYDRATRTTHWADHADWEERDERSCRALRALFSGELRGAHGVGTARSIADYERHIGMRLISDDTWAKAISASLSGGRV